MYFLMNSQWETAIVDAQSTSFRTVFPIISDMGIGQPTYYSHIYPVGGINIH